MSVYYNENDPAAAHVLRALIKDGVIADGDVDDRSITEVTPDDVKGYTQCHYFAGGGLWSVAARLAGWPDERPLWTGSCPCQPFSAAGKHKGTDDPRHLWPHFYRLIREVRPDIVMGEQVSGKPGYGWLDGVCNDLEAEDYTCRAADIAACAIDAPHQRSRLYWYGKVANAEVYGGRQLQRRGSKERTGKGEQCVSASSDVCARENTERKAAITNEFNGRNGARGHDGPEAGNAHESGNLANASGEGLQGHRQCDAGAQGRQESIGQNTDADDSYWSAAEWIECYDGKARRTQPDIRFLVDGISIPLDACDSGSVARLQETKKAEVTDGQLAFKKGRVDLWKITGNAIVPPLAAEFISSLMCEPA